MNSNKNCKSSSNLSLWGATKTIFKGLGCLVNATALAAESLQKSAESMAQSAHLAKLESTREFLEEMGYTEDEIEAVDIEMADKIINHNLLATHRGDAHIDLRAFVDRSVAIKELTQKMNNVGDMLPFQNTQKGQT